MALEWFKQQIRIGIDQGDIDHDADPAATAVILLGVMQGVMLQVNDRIRLNAVRDRLLAIVEAVSRPKKKRGGRRHDDLADAGKQLLQLARPPNQRRSGARAAARPL